MKKRITVILIIAVAAVSGLILYSLLRNEKFEKISTTGIVEGTEVNLSSKIPGRISEICCREGDTVEKDKVAITIESQETRASMEQAAASLEKARTEVKSAGALIESSKADMQTSEADIKNAEAEVKKAKVQMDEAQLQMDRVTALFREGLVSKADDDRAVASFESLRAAYEASQARREAVISRKELSASQLYYSQSQLASAKARVKEAEAALAVQSARLDDAVIKTPVSGTVVFKGMETGEFVSPGAIILTVIDMENLWVRIDVEESIVGYIRPGSQASIKINGMSGTVIKGTVSKIGRYAEFATLRDVRHGVQDIKTFQVELAVEDPGRVLKPGMTVNVEIPVREQ